MSNKIFFGVISALILFILFILIFPTKWNTERTSPKIIHLKDCECRCGSVENRN